MVLFCTWAECSINLTVPVTHFCGRVRIAGDWGLSLGVLSWVIHDLPAPLICPFIQPSTDEEGQHTARPDNFTGLGNAGGVRPISS